MTTEQQIKILECAAKACGLEKAPVFSDGSRDIAMRNRWNPLISPADTAEMCAKLLIDTCFYLQLGRVTCDFYYGTDNIRDRVRVEFKDHDNSRLKAWMYAATMVAAKIGGMK